MITAFANTMKVPDLRSRILFTPVSYTHLTLPTKA